MALADAPEMIDAAPMPPTGWDILTQPRPFAFGAALTTALDADADRHTRQVQQMLVAGSMAAGAILAIAAVMLLRLL